MSEKLDGVRCYWSGAALYSRNGVKINAPQEWVDNLPKIALDGELWTGRDDFHKAVTITIHRPHGMEDWKDVKFMIFDAPLVPGGFEERIKFVSQFITSLNPYVKLIQ